MNYKHLRYFLVVARTGGISRASEALHVTPHTISGQISLLEDSLGHKLFVRKGRSLVLTPTGHVVLKYAEQIFSLGEELNDVLRGAKPFGHGVFTAGVMDGVPKIIAQQILAPVMEAKDVRLVCHEGGFEYLASRLAVRELDLVISDMPLNAAYSIKAYNHKLGESTLSCFAAKGLARQYRRNFPASLGGAPMLLPTNNSTIRPAIDQWLLSEGIVPELVGEFDDSALLKAFGEGGAGVFFMPSIIEKAVCSHYNVSVIGTVDKVSEQFYALSLERQLGQGMPLMRKIYNAARQDLFKVGGTARRMPGSDGPDPDIVTRKGIK